MVCVILWRVCEHSVAGVISSPLSQGSALADSAASQLAPRLALFGDLWVLVLPAPRRAEADARPGEAICVFFASVCFLLRL